MLFPVTFMSRKSHSTCTHIRKLYTSWLNPLSVEVNDARKLEKCFFLHVPFVVIILEVMGDVYGEVSTQQTTSELNEDEAINKSKTGQESKIQASHLIMLICRFLIALIL